MHYYKFKATKFHHEKKWCDISDSGQTIQKQISISLFGKCFTIKKSLVKTCVLYSVRFCVLPNRPSVNEQKYIMTTQKNVRQQPISNVTFLWTQRKWKKTSHKLKSLPEKKKLLVIIVNTPASSLQTKETL